MKRKILILGLSFIILLASITNVNASTASVTLKTSSKEVKAGETFTLTIGVQSADGINGLSTELNYDNSKVEIKEAGLVDTTNWSFLGQENKVDILYNSTNQTTEADVYKVIFKVKDDVKSGTELTVGTKGILVDTNATSNSTVSLSEQNVTVKVVGTTSDIQEEDDSNLNSGSNEQDSGSNNLGNNSSGNKTSGNSLGEKDSTTSNETMPKTGRDSKIVLLIGTTVLLGILYITHLNIKKYKKL